MEIKSKIGKRLRELRKAKGLSQEKFSFECNPDRTYIASYCCPLKVEIGILVCKKARLVLNTSTGSVTTC